MNAAALLSDSRVLARLWPMLWRYRARLIASMLCACAMALLSGMQLVLAKPTLERLFLGAPAAASVQLDAAAPTLPALKDRLLGGLDRLIDSLSARFPGSRLAPLAVVALMLVVVTVAKGMAQFGQEYLISYCSARVVYDLREALFQRLTSASLSFFQRERVGELLTRTGADLDLLGRLTQIACGELVRGPMTVAVTVCWLFVLHPVMALTSLVILGGSAWLIARFGTRIKTARQSAQSYMADQVSVEQECFSNIRVVRAFGMEDYQRKRFSRANRLMLGRLMKIAQARAAVTPLMESLGAVAGAGLLVVGGYLVLERGALNGAEFMAFLFALLFLYQPCKRTAHAYNDLQQALVGAQRAFELFDRAVELKDRPAAVPLRGFHHEIRFEDVCFSYDGKIDALRHVNLRIARGEIVAIVGPSGAGKTTLMDLLMRFYDPVRGRILIDGVDLRDVTQASLRAQIGLVPQEVMLFNDTVRRNIAFGRDDLPDEAIIDCARRAHAHEFIVQLPDGYDTVLGERGVGLSGGQRQRLAIARALVKNPRILIFDEATSSLDTESEHLVRQAMHELFADRTVLIVAHRFSTVADADRIVVLDRGSIVDVGRHAELLARCPLYQRLYELQHRPASADRL